MMLWLLQVILIVVGSSRKKIVGVVPVARCPCCQAYGKLELLKAIGAAKRAQKTVVIIAVPLKKSAGGRGQVLRYISEGWGWQMKDYSRYSSISKHKCSLVFSYHISLCIYLLLCFLSVGWHPGGGWGQTSEYSHTGGPFQREGNFAPRELEVFGFLRCGKHGHLTYVSRDL